MDFYWTLLVHKRTQDKTALPVKNLLMTKPRQRLILSKPIK